MTPIEAYGMLAAYEDEGRLKLAPILTPTPDGEPVDVALPRMVAWAVVSGWLPATTHIGEFIVAVERGVAAFTAGRVSEIEVKRATWAVMAEVMQFGATAEAEMN